MALLRRGRIRTAALAALALASAVTAGCASSGGSAANATGPLSVWIRGSGDSVKAYQAIFAAFTAQTGVKVNVYRPVDDFETKLQQAAARAEAARHRRQRHRPARHPREAGHRARGHPGRRSPAATSSPPPPGTRPKAPTARLRACRSRRSPSPLFIRKDWREKLRPRPAQRPGRSSTRCAAAFTTGRPGRQRQGRHLRLSTCPAPPSAATSPGTSRASCGRRRRLLHRRRRRQVHRDHRQPGRGRRRTEFKEPVLHRQDRRARRVPQDHPGRTRCSRPARPASTSPARTTWPASTRTSARTSTRSSPRRPVPAAAASLAEGENVYLMAGSKTDRAGEVRRVRDLRRGADHRHGRRDRRQRRAAAGQQDRRPGHGRAPGRPALVFASRSTRTRATSSTLGARLDAVPPGDLRRDLNAIVANCGDPKHRMATLNAKFQSLLKQAGRAGG